MGWSPQASIELTFGGGQPVSVDWSLSPVGADDSPRQILIHRAVHGMVDLVKAREHDKIAAIEAALRDEFNL